MSASATSNVLRFPTTRKRAYAQPGYRGLRDLPDGVVRLRKPPAIPDTTMPRTGLTALLTGMVRAMKPRSRERLFRALARDLQEQHDAAALVAFDTYMAMSVPEECG